MKRYRFRLAAVQRVRSIELDRAVGEVARARHDLVAAQARTAAAEQAYRDMPRQPAGPTPADLRALFEQLRVSSEAVVWARNAERDQEQVVAARMADWAEADRRVRLLEQLDERHRARHAAEVLVEEQQALDDLVTSRQGRDAA